MTGEAIAQIVKQQRAYYATGETLSVDKRIEALKNTLKISGTYKPCTKTNKK